MYDGIKIRVDDGVTNIRLLNNHLLDFTGTYKATGEDPTEADKRSNYQFNRKVAKYKQLEFTVHDSGLVEINRSIHKYWNNGLHNYNQFTIENVKQTLDRLVQDFGIDPDTATVHNLEIGANLITPFNPDQFINSLVVHKYATFNKMEVKQGNGRQTVKKGKQYGLKIYNKSAQYAEHTSDNLLRFEVKYLKMEAITKGKVCLTTLLHPAFIERCEELVLQAFDEVVIKEPVDLKSLSIKQRDLYLKCINPLYWATLSSLDRCRNKKRYADLLELKSIDRLKEKTRSILVQTLRDLIGKQTKKCNDLTGFEKPLLQSFDHLSKVSIHCNTQMPVTNCITCNRDISSQRKGSKYCSEKVYGKGAKQCRNANSNPRNNYKGKIQQLHNKGLLFDLMPYVKVPSYIPSTMPTNTQFKIRK